MCQAVETLQPTNKWQILSLLARRRLLHLLARKLVTEYSAKNISISMIGSHHQPYVSVATHRLTG